MKAVSVPQPWAWAAASGHADVVNLRFRSAARPSGEELAIYAGTFMDRDAFHDRMLDRALAEAAPPPVFHAGKVIGLVRLTGCTRKSRSEWARPAWWHWEIEDARALAEPVSTYPMGGPVWDLSEGMADLIRRRAES